MERTGAGTGIAERKIDGYDVLVDGREATISAEVPEEVIHRGYSGGSDQGQTVYTNPAGLLRRGDLPSLSVIRFAKIKNFIDGVYAAAEQRVHETGHRLSMPGFLSDLEKDLKGDARAYIRRIKSGNARDDPIFKVAQGFYDWSKDLGAAYRQIKLAAEEPRVLLGSEDNNFNNRILSEVSIAIEGSTNLAKRYAALRNLYAMMTNKPEEFPSLFPAAMLPDQEFFKRLSGARGGGDLPEGLGKLLVEAVREGDVTFIPKKDSGLYIRQMHEITPLVTRNVPEFDRFLTNKGYNHILESEFISQWAGTRHTHVGHSHFGDMLMTCCIRETPIEIEIRPELEVEPFATSYDRMEASLGFLEEVVRTNVPEIFKRKRLIREGLRSDKKIGDEFDEMRRLARGLALISRDSIHESYAASSEQSEAIDTARGWIKNAEYDPDLNRNCAIFVPIIRTADGSRFISYIDAGFRTIDVKTRYQDHPEVSIPRVEEEAKRRVREKDPSDFSFDRRSLVIPTFKSKEYTLPVLVHREVRVPYAKLINDRRLREMLKSDSFTEQELNGVVSRLEAG